MTRELPLGSMHDVVETVLAQSPRLRARVEHMLDMLLDDMEQVIRIGYRPHITPLQRAILPGLLRGLQNGQNANQEATERAAYESILEELRGDIIIDASVSID